jgi:predicted kinase
MADVPQDSIWHAEGNVQIHTKMVCEELLKLPEFQTLSEQDKHVMFVSALMHDIEKRSTTVEDFRNGRMCIVAPKHAEAGEGTAREILYKELGCSYHIREKICKVVRWHGKPLHTNHEKVIIKLASEVSPYLLSMIAKADILGRICDDAEENLERAEFFALFAEELGCLHGPREFSTDLAEYVYLNSDDEGYLEYEPFDETKFEVLMMSALPGTGKDHWIKQNRSDWNVVSLDDIRVELGVKPTDKSGNGRVIQLAKERAKQFMRKRENFIWNATNITAQMRSQLIELFESYGGKVSLVYLEVPYKTLISQNSSREAELPKAVIEKMIRKWEPPTRKEACSIILGNI